MRRHKGQDGWGRDSYAIPEYAVAGCSCTGDGGPAPGDVAKEELTRLRTSLRTNSVPGRLTFKATPSGNCCMVKVWLVATAKTYALAAELAAAWLADHKGDTRLIHNAT